MLLSDCSGEGQYHPRKRRKVPNRIRTSADHADLTNRVEYSGEEDVEFTRTSVCEQADRLHCKGHDEETATQGLVARHHRRRSFSSSSGAPFRPTPLAAQPEPRVSRTATGCTTSPPLVPPHAPARPKPPASAAAPITKVDDYAPDCHEATPEQALQDPGRSQDGDASAHVPATCASIPQLMQQMRQVLEDQSREMEALVLGYVAAAAAGSWELHQQGQELAAQVRTVMKRNVRTAWDTARSLEKAQAALREAQLRQALAARVARADPDNSKESSFHTAAGSPVLSINSRDEAEGTSGQNLGPNAKLAGDGSDEVNSFCPRAELMNPQLPAAEFQGAEEMAGENPLLPAHCSLSYSAPACSAEQQPEAGEQLPAQKVGGCLQAAPPQSAPQSPENRDGNLAPYGLAALLEKLQHRTLPSSRKQTTDKKEPPPPRADRPPEPKPQPTPVSNPGYANPATPAAASRPGTLRESILTRAQRRLAAPEKPPAALPQLPGAPMVGVAGVQGLSDSPKGSRMIRFPECRVTGAPPAWVAVPLAGKRSKRQIETERRAHTAWRAEPAVEPEPPPAGHGSDATVHNCGPSQAVFLLSVGPEGPTVTNRAIRALPAEAVPDDQLPGQGCPSQLPAASMLCGSAEPLQCMSSAKTTRQTPGKHKVLHEVSAAEATLAAAGKSSRSMMGSACTTNRREQQAENATCSLGDGLVRDSTEAMPAQTLQPTYPLLEKEAGMTTGFPMAGAANDPQSQAADRTAANFCSVKRSFSKLRSSKLLPALTGSLQLGFEQVALQLLSDVP